ncbi:tetratricopeptide repeat protein, partial [Hyphomonas atlantica]|uniref:tetratricopeptide repeat protein n=1 Tax=Hyphomonas atlantica TaxID=1280948 RepID=UPI0005514BF0
SNWAATQNNLGAALQTLGEIAGDAVRLEEAAAAYRAALEVYTREAMPSNWAMTQNNLGIALQTLGEIAGDAVRLEEAVRLWEQVADFYTSTGNTRKLEQVASNAERARKLIIQIRNK